MTTPIPKPLTGPAAWVATDLERSNDWLVTLDADEITCLDDALDSVMSQQITWSSLTKDQFPLPRLAKKLEVISKELEDGCGMVSLRGISPGRYTADELRTLWCGLGLNLGVLVYQNPQGQLLRDICNEGVERPRSRSGIEQQPPEAMQRRLKSSMPPQSAPRTMRQNPRAHRSKRSTVSNSH